MQILKTTAMILFAISVSQTSYAFSKPPKLIPDTCPAENTIQQIGVHYTAPNGWFGNVQTKPGKVKNFEMVLYKSENTQTPFNEGKLLRCSYRLDNGNSVDLRLPEAKSKARITNSKNWEAAYAGNQYDCSKSRLACEFNLVK